MASSDSSGDRTSSSPNGQTYSTGRPHSRSTDSAKSLSRDQILSASMGTVKTANAARMALVRQKYFPDRDSITLDRLPLVLLQISAVSKMTALEAEATRAVALIMEEMMRSRTVDDIVGAIMTKLNPPLATLNETGQLMGANTEEVRSSVTCLANTVEEHKIECRDAAQEITEAGSRVEKAAKQMDSILEQALKDNPNLFNYNDPVPFKPATDNNIHRYYNIAPHLAAPTSIHSNAVARYDEKAKQILITVTEGNETLGLGNLEPHELVEKANLALTKILETEPANEPPSNPQILGAQTRRNGDLLLHASSKETARWLLHEEIRNEFIKNFSSKAAFKDRQYQLIVEFVPISFKPGTFFENVEITTVNNILHDSILSARWIRPVESRKANQKVAHAIIGFNSPETANKVIKNGLFIKGKRTAPRKLLPDPRRCFKCHKYDANHLAKDCKQIHEWCDICGETNHDGKGCPNKENDPLTFLCIPCNTKRHSTRDRRCPTFRNEYAKLASNVSNSQYRYFVTSEPETWETLDPYSYQEDDGTWTQVSHRKKQAGHGNSRQQPTHAPTKRTGANTIPISTNRTNGTKQTNLDHYLSQGQQSTGPSGPPPSRSRAFSRSWADDYEDSDVAP